jgi:hypothetical protein
LVTFVFRPWIGPKLPLESKAMNFPFGLIEGFWLGDGAFDSLIRFVSPVWRSCV